MARHACTVSVVASDFSFAVTPSGPSSIVTQARADAQLAARIAGFRCHSLQQHILVDDETGDRQIVRIPAEPVPGRRQPGVVEAGPPAAGVFDFCVAGQGPGGSGGGFGGGGFENIDPRVFSEIFSNFGGGRSAGGAGGAGGAPGGGARTFRFSTGGQGAGADNDILRSIFGGGRPQQDRPAAKPARGADVKAEIAVTLEDIAAGKKPAVSLKAGKTVTLTLPNGVSDGQVIRLKGQGQPSPSGGAAGDALVTVRFVPHPLFTVSGADLRIDAPVALADAVLGAKVAVPTLAGRVQISVPAMADTGKAMRLKGKGLPRKGGHGDLIVDLKITLPDSPDAELDALMQSWRDAGKAKKPS